MMARASRGGSALLAVVLALATPVQAETLIPAAGGGGGGPFVARCPGNESLSGLLLRSGSWVDAVQAECSASASVDINAPAIAGDMVDGGGGGGGGRKDLPCNFNMRVWALDVGHGMVTDHTRAVTAIGLVCGRADGRGTTRVADSAFFPPEKPKNRLERLSCPPGQVAIGIHGRSGQWVDALGLICGPPRLG